VGRQLRSQDPLADLLQNIVVDHAAQVGQHPGGRRDVDAANRHNVHGPEAAHPSDDAHLGRFCRHEVEMLRLAGVERRSPVDPRCQPV